MSPKKVKGKRNNTLFYMKQYFFVEKETGKAYLTTKKKIRKAIENKYKLKWVWWPVLVIPALNLQRQEDYYCKSKGSLGPVKKKNSTPEKSPGKSAVLRRTADVVLFCPHHLQSSE